MVKSNEDASYFLLSILSITEGPTNKIMRKSGIPSSVPCRDSTLEQFFFYRVSGKMQKLISSKQYFSHKSEAPENII